MIGAAVTARSATMSSLPSISGKPRSNQDYVRLLSLHLAQHFGCITCLGNVERLRTQADSQELANGLLVVDDENSRYTSCHRSTTSIDG